MNKLRWGKFYWSDWAGDTALAACSIAAQGLWMRLLCIAAQGAPYGYVTVGGKHPSDSLLKRLVQQPGMRLRDFRHLLEELERNGVVKRTDDGTLYSLRMVRDFARAEHASRGGKNRHRTTTGQPPDNHPATNGEPRNSAESRGNGRANVAGANGIQKQEADTKSPKRDFVSADQSDTAERVVRFDGARAPPRRNGEAEEARERIRRFVEQDRIVQ